MNSGEGEPTQFVGTRQTPTPQVYNTNLTHNLTNNNIYCHVGPKPTVLDYS